MRLGGVDTVKVDVRIVAATNVDLQEMVADGRFREDLYYRLHVITIELPPLRERREDIPPLAQHFLKHYGEENSKGNLELLPETLRLLEDYDWPGNVRELENVIERAVVLTGGSEIGPDLVPDSVRASASFQLPNFAFPPEGIPFRQVVDDWESKLITAALEAAGGVQKRAAGLLQVKPTTLNQMIKRHGIRPGRHRGPGTEVSPSPGSTDAGKSLGGERQGSTETKTPDLSGIIGRRSIN
jgi:two-component system response regulator PilR (NtrC family)